MNKWKKRLSLLLLLQIGLAGGLWARSYSESVSRTKTQKLLSFEMSEITRLEVSEKDRSILLSQEEGRWVLPDHHSLPVEKKRVQSLLESLLELQSSFPETTSTSAHQRLGLSDEQPEGRIKLFAGEKLVGDLVLGEIPSFGQRYVRLGGLQEAYRIRWQTINTQAASRAWLESGLLAVESPQKVELPKFAMQLQAGNWVSGRGKIDQKKANALADKIRKLSVLDVANDVQPPIATEVRVEDAQGQAYTYTFFEREGKHFVSRDDIDHVFQTSSETSKALLEAELSSLKEKEPEEASTQSP